MHILRPTIAALLVIALVPAQGFSKSSTSQMRYVDFHRDLDRPGVVVVVGQLGKMKEGRRQRLRDGKLGGGGSVTQVSGTQYFEVPVKTTIRPRVVFAGKPGKLRLEFAIQLARLPDGSERRQARTGNGAELAEDTLALFVMAPPPKGRKGKKGKGLDLLQVIPFDAKIDKGPDAEAKYVDAMHDFYAVNRRVADIEAALAAFDAATDAAATKVALARMQELADQELELRISQNDSLLHQHVGPLEARMKKRLAASSGKGAGKH